MFAGEIMFTGETKMYLRVYAFEKKYGIVIRHTFVLYLTPSWEFVVTLDGDYFDGYKSRPRCGFEEEITRRAKQRGWYVP